MKKTGANFSDVISETRFVVATRVSLIAAFHKPPA